MSTHWSALQPNDQRNIGVCALAKEINTPRAVDTKQRERMGIYEEATPSNHNFYPVNREQESASKALPWIRLFV